MPKLNSAEFFYVSKVFEQDFSNEKDGISSQTFEIILLIEYPFGGGMKEIYLFNK